MSYTLNVDNFTALNAIDKLVLNADSAASITTIPTVNSEGISSNQFLILGYIGSEGSEKIQTIATNPILSPTSFQITGGTKFAHKQFEPITALFGDTIKLYRAPNVDGTIPSDANFTYLLSQVIDYDEVSTAVTDPNGSNGYWYKFTYLNSLTNAETNISDSPIVIRGGQYGVYTSVYNIRREAGMLNNQYVTDSMIDAARYRAQYEIDGGLAGMYPVPFQPPINPMIAALTEKLSAFYLLSTDYGPLATGNSKSATDKQTEFQRLMDNLDTKKYILTDTNGNDLSFAGAGGIKSWPNKTTSTTPTDQGGSDRTFRIGQRF